MSKILIRIIIVIGIIYIWFALLPNLTDFSFPTGGWDWLSFTGNIFVILITAWGIVETINSNYDQIMKQQQLSVIPCLDINCIEPFNPNSSNRVFRFLTEGNQVLINDGYIMLRNGDRDAPEHFETSANIRVTNIGLSTAYSINTYLYKLNRVEGLNNLSEISNETILNFYDKINISNYTYEESNEQKQTDWLISPTFNLTTNHQEFNLVFDFSGLTTDYHSILKFVFEDIYENKYYQYIYINYGNNLFSGLPSSKIYKSKNKL